MQSVQENGATAIAMATDAPGGRNKAGAWLHIRRSGAASFVLQGIQPALLGLMDGAVSTLAPIFAAAGLTGRPLSAFFVGLAASLGAPSAWASQKPCPTTGASPGAAARFVAARSPGSRPGSAACSTPSRSSFRISPSR